MFLIKVLEKPITKLRKKQIKVKKRKRSSYDACLKNEQAWVELYQRIWLYRELYTTKNYVTSSTKLKHKSQIKHIKCVLMHIKSTRRGVAWNKINNLGWCGECGVYVNIKDRNCICCGMQYRRNPHQKSEQASPKQNAIRAQHEISI